MVKELILYEGNVPKSGKTYFEFAGHKLAHLSKVADKSDYLIHIETKIVLRAYPTKTDRSIVLDDMAKNMSKLESFINSPELYDVMTREDYVELHAPKVVEQIPNVVEMKTYADGSCVAPRQPDKKPMRKFNMRGQVQ